LNRLQEASTSKRLNLVYLANEVVQQSRARSKTDFLLAFEPLIGDATALAYKNASVEIQNKIRRVIEVWRQRAIFDTKIQDALEKRLDDIDKTRGAQRGIGGGGKLGGSLFGGGSGGGVPAELEPVSKSQTVLTKTETSARGVVATANTEHAKLTDPNTPLPSPPVHAAKLASLMKTLASAHSAVESSIKARTELIAGLEQLLEKNRTSLATDQATATELSSRLTTTENRKREVEDGIMRGLSNPTTPSNQPPGVGSGPSSNGANDNELTAPDYEEFTPPPEIESFTPPPAVDAGENDLDSFAIGEDVPAEQLLADTSGAEVISEQQPTHDEPPPSHEPPPVLESHPAKPDNAFGADILSSLQMPQVRHASSEIPAESADPRLKRRKVSHNQSDDVIGSNGVDEDSVAAMLQ
jgi:regulator of Ty1 transposition protein 103